MLDENNKSLSDIIPEEPKDQQNRPVDTGVHIDKSVVNGYFNSVNNLAAQLQQNTLQSDAIMPPNITEIMPIDNNTADDFIPITDEDIRQADQAKFAQQMKDRQTADLNSLLDKMDENGKELDVMSDYIDKTGDVKAYEETRERYEKEKTDVVVAGADEDDDSTVTAKPVEKEPKKDKDEDDDSYDESSLGINDDDFTPTFIDTEEEEEAAPVENSKDKDEEDNSEETSDEEDENYDTYDGVVNIIAKAPVIDYTTDKKSLVTTIKNRKSADQIVPSGKFNNKTFNDTAFDNHISRFKTQNYRTVRVPLANSGFMADVIGTGANDLIMLYDSTDSRITNYEYELQRLQTTIRSVVNVTPKEGIQPAMLKNIIHHRDYLMLSYAHMCATLDEIFIPHTCPHCDHSFNIKVNPADMLLNSDEFDDITAKIESSKTASENSLMDKNIVRKFDSGFTVTFGHPSYYDEITTSNEITKLLRDGGLNKVTQHRLAHMVNNLMYVRKISLPSGLTTANMYQKFRALQAMSSLDEFTTLNEFINEMRKDIIVPKFGIPNVSCPRCHKKIEEIPVGSVADMVFYHITVVQAKRDASKKSAENGTKE